MGIPTLIKTLTASGSDYLDFVDGTSGVVLDGTYDEYMFVWTDVGPADDGVHFQFSVNATDDAGGDYDVSVICSSYFQAYNYESGGTPALGYEEGNDLDNIAGFQTLTNGQGNGTDESSAGILHLFSPSSTVYVKQFYCRCQSYHSLNVSNDMYIAGYINDTTAIDEIRFKFSAGAFDGVIQLYGIA